MAMPTNPLSAVDCVRPAVDRTEKFMFSPFRWARWWRMALLGLATGEFASQGGCNFGGGDWSKITNPSGGGATSPLPHSIPGITAATIATLITVAVVGAIVLVIVHLYVSSVARFMYFDAVATGRVRLREGWKRWSAHGFRYFLFNLAFMAIVFGIFLLTGGFIFLLAWKSGVFHNAKEHAGMIVLAAVVLLPIFLLFMLLLMVAGVLIKDFLIPIIALEDITIPDALWKLWRMIKTKKSDYAMYLLIKIAMAVGVGIALGIINLIIIVVLAVPVVIVLVAMVAANPASLHNPAVIAGLITLGICALVPLLIVMGLIAAPAVVFYEAYVLNFFASRYAPLWTLMNPESPAGGGPESVVPQHEPPEPPPYPIIPPEPLVG